MTNPAPDMRTSGWIDVAEAHDRAYGNRQRLLNRTPMAHDMPAAQKHREALERAFEGLLELGGFGYANKALEDARRAVGRAHRRELDIDGWIV